MRFKGKVGIVTGAARGIGRAICLELAREGCQVAFNYAHSDEDAAKLVSELAANGNPGRCYQCDVSDSASVDAMVKDVRQKFGRVDYLVNNAGITRDKLILRMSETDWDEVLNTNLKGCFNFAKAVSAAMVRARFGAILNITSVSGLVGMPGQVNYAASKAGMIGLTKSLAKELAARNITVNALALGFIKTGMTAILPEEQQGALLSAIPLGRYGNAEEVAKIAAFLLSDDARYITGQVIQVDGGLAI